MKKLLITCWVLLLVSCNNSYQYVEVIHEESIFGDVERTEKEPENFREKNDSLAYLEAYQKFLISKKIAKEMEESFGKVHKKPQDFKLIDSRGKEILYPISRENRDYAEGVIEERVNALPRLIK